MSENTKEYFKEQDKKRLLKIIGNTGLAIGAMTVGAILSNPVALSALMGLGVERFYRVGEHAIARRYDDLGMAFSRFIPGLPKTMSQSSGVSRKMKKQLHEINMSSKEIAELMVEQIVLGIDREKRSLEGKKKQEVERTDGSKHDVYRQKYKTTTHSCNIGTLKILHELGYIDIQSIDYNRKSELRFEKFGAGVMTHGLVQTVKETIKNRKDKQKYDMYDVKFKMTDKEIVLEEILEELQGKVPDSSSININYLSKKEGKLNEEDKQVIIDKRKQADIKHTRIASRLIKNGMKLIKFNDSKYGIGQISYVKKDDGNSVFSRYNLKKEKEKERKSWIVKEDEKTQNINDRSKEREAIVSDKLVDGEVNKNVNNVSKFDMR